MHYVDLAGLGLTCSFRELAESQRKLLLSSL
jgi:hypothetical protein